MQYSPRIIILAAGQGTRLRNLCNQLPKVLVPINGEPLLQRTIRQFLELGWNKITVVVGHQKELVISCATKYYPQVRYIVNDRYKEDRNIYSLICGFEENNEPAIVIEGDVVISDAAMPQILNLAGQPQSVWTSCGLFQPTQVGGIIEQDANNNITDIRYAHYSEALSHYYKNLGLIYFEETQLPLYRELLNIYLQKSIDTYFMTPWLENLQRLPCKLLDLGKDSACSFNTPEEYQHAMDIFSQSNIIVEPILLELDSLVHIEDYCIERAKWLAQKIELEGVWTVPLCIDDKHSLVMDGQHRMEAARLLGLKRIPVLLFDYTKVKVWSLRKDIIIIDGNCVIKKIQGKQIFPYKTVKHDFSYCVPQCSYMINTLR